MLILWHCKLEDNLVYVQKYVQTQLSSLFFTVALAMQYITTKTLFFFILDWKIWGLGCCLGLIGVTVIGVHGSASARI